MRLCSSERKTWAVWAGWAAVAALALPLAGYAATCTTQGAMAAGDRNVLATAGAQIAEAVIEQDDATLQAALLPAEAGAWNGIHEAVDDAAPLLKGGKVELRNLYLLDATGLTAPADTQFFCSSADGSLTATITMRALPPGKYAVVLADAAGAAMDGQMGVILGWTDSGWRLAGLTVRPGVLDGHDGVWYWTRARELAANGQPWSAWITYQTARGLLLPVDFLSSPNLEKLDTEASQIAGSPQNAFPYAVPDGDRTWKIDSIHADATLNHDDVGVVYESTGVSDAAAQRTEAVTVLSALLKARPELRQNFHGLWAYAAANGKTTPVMELPMGQIP
jgi:uncharacterized protein (DUF2141 family)